MKNKSKKLIATTALVAFLAAPAVGLDYVKTNMLISPAPEPHWAKEVVMELEDKYELTELFTNENLDASIDTDVFVKAVQTVINKDYQARPEAITREAVVHELVNIWSQETGIDSDKVPVVRMLFYTDMEKAQSKYVQSIYVAWMKDIAKGKAPMEFMPKAHVSYAELASMVKRTKDAINLENAAYEGILETKAAYEIKDGKMLFDIELVNHGEESLTMIMGSGIQFDISIFDKDDKEIYRYAENRPSTLALVYKELEAGKSLKWDFAWDMKDRDGKELTDDNYRAKVTVLANIMDDHREIPQRELNTEFEFNKKQVKETK